MNLEGVSFLPMHRAQIPAMRWGIAEEERLVRNGDW